MSDKLFALAKAGEVNEMLEALSQAQAADDDGSETVVASYQWLLVAAALGSEEAEGMAEDLVEAALSRYGDETIAMAHFEVGGWWLLGQEGVTKDSDKAFAELEYADEMGVREMVDIESELEKLRSQSGAAERERLATLFPPRG